MILALCLLAVQQPTLPAETWFSVHPASVSRDKGPPLLVSVQRSEASARVAFRELARAMRWDFLPLDAGVEAQIDPVSIKLALTRQPPRQVAELIAAASGLAVEFSRGERGVQVKLVLRPETAASARACAATWYQRALDLDSTRITPETRQQALIGLGRVRVGEGDFNAAIAAFNQVFEEDDSRRFARIALVEKCRVHMRLAVSEGVSTVQSQAQMQMACDAARRLWQFRDDADAGDAALLRGEVLERSGRHREAVDALVAARLIWTRTPQANAIRLLMARCYTSLGTPREALNMLRQFGDLGSGASAGVAMTVTERRGYHFLRGVALERIASAGELSGAATAEYAVLALRSLEDFIAMARPQDPSRTDALLSLARAYFLCGRHLQSIATERLVTAAPSKLSSSQLQAARLLRVRSMIATGARERALKELAIATRPDPDRFPLQVFFLADAWLESAEYDRALTILKPLIEHPGATGDSARERAVAVMVAQARRREDLAACLPPVLALVNDLQTESSRVRLARRLGDLFLELDMPDRAAAAYRGER